MPRRPSGNFLSHVSDEVRIFLEQRRRERRLDLVLQGGGVKGVALVGAWSVLEGGEFSAQRLAGSSAGAIVAALIAAGYSAAELKSIMLDLDFRDFMDKAGDDDSPLNMAITFARHKGIYKGDACLGWLREALADKGISTFGDLSPFEKASPLQIIVSDTTLRRLLVLPRDAWRLGIEGEGLELALAVRMSMSIPGFFQPVQFQNPQTGQTHLLVDGGLLSNFPIWLFDRKGLVPRWPTFGLALLSEPEDLTSEPVGATRYVKNLVYTMLEAHDRMVLDEADWQRTIPIPTLGVSTTDFDLDGATKLALFEAGQQAARSFIRDWNFAEYIAGFRLPDAPEDILSSDSRHLT